jgi:hypothetical protein
MFFYIKRYIKRDTSSGSVLPPARSNAAGPH